MYNKMKANIYGSVIMLVIIISCQKSNETISIANYEPNNPELVLGKQLENPYSVTNMRKALSVLKKETRSGLSSEEVIQATHHYIRFLPKDKDDVSVLKSDTTLILYDYPLDYEILSYGGYHDPTCPRDTPTPLYASVPISYHLPDNVEYEVLEDLFIPDEYDLTETRSDYSSTFIKELVDKSLELTGNSDPDYSETKGGGSWHPRGSIRYFDATISAYVPIVGLQIRCRRWFTTYTAYTDWRGEFYCPETFSKSAEYSVVFERYDFEIKDAWLSTAKYQQDNQVGEWIVDFKNNALCTYYCTIFRAAFKYYYQDIHGLSTPPRNSFWKNKLTILASTKDKETEYGNTALWRRFFTDSEIKLYTYAKDSRQTYATTIHELAHAAHWQLVIDAEGSNRNRDYNYAESSMVESWATGVQWYLTKDAYPSYRGKYPFSYYTNVVLDLIDDDDASNNGKPKDGVSGINIVDIQNALIGCNTWEGWKNNIAAKYEDKRTQIENLFDSWKSDGGF